MINIHKKYSVKLIGGCCLSDERHIEEIAKLLIS
ncbi:MAG: homocysteine S-methyltransferase family protein [Desulfobacterales bacterium]|nr:homocysteine S-methyltransferase family protein [Desulfobacterales bacterium]MCP4160781.1 homocysteine S-methyltransferase family protein [Deltaproteobacteria bacterium]